LTPLTDLSDLSRQAESLVLRETPAPANAVDRAAAIDQTAVRPLLVSDVSGSLA